MNYQFTIIVPVYNEEDNVHPLVKQISEALVNFDYEIIYVDDGSTDNTIKNLKTIDNHRLKIYFTKKP